MASPFPGMDPYLERPEIWPNFHSTFIAVARDVLAPRLRPNFFVGIEERVYNCDEALIINYRAEPTPPLRPPRQEWADKLLKSKGLR